MSDPSTAQNPGDSVAGRGEFALIDALTRRLPQAEDVDVVPGDDAAVVRIDGTPVVVTTDVLVAGVHFRTDWSGPDDIGHRAAAASLADLVAMGADPVALVVALVAPPTTDSAWVLRIADGLRDEAALTGASVVGGDLSSGRRHLGDGDRNRGARRAIACSAERREGRRSRGGGGSPGMGRGWPRCPHQGVSVASCAGRCLPAPGDPVLRGVWRVRGRSACDV